MRTTGVSVDRDETTRRVWATLGFDVDSDAALGRWRG